MAAFSLFGFFRFYGLEDEPNMEQELNVFHFPWPIFLLLGAIAGLMHAFIEGRMQSRHLLMRRPYWMILAIKVPIYGFLALLLIYAAGIGLNHFFFGQADWGVLWKVAQGKVFWVFLVFFLATSFLISFFQIIRQYFGDRVLFNLLGGKYYRPFEEYRIFLFVDMRNSTGIAEQLGTIQYSRFVQDAFRDFTRVIQRHRPEVYQYVGDEVVLTWQPEIGLKNYNCLHACFAFNEILQSKSDYYLAEYGIVPTFKAGGHIGRVRVTEVGVLHRAIAYHGDVMNTTARIMAQCNTLGYDLLISEQLWKELPKRETEWTFTQLGEATLKGKAFAVNLVGVSRV
jgi:adenylate cyclase